MEVCAHFCLYLSTDKSGDLFFFTLETIIHIPELTDQELHDTTMSESVK